MNTTGAQLSAFPDSKNHYLILDGLRGIAALMVVIFHILEAHSTSYLDMMMNHGYLAVDFFFLLSGYVIGYAYDDRWNKMTLGGFFKRRLIRLHPMIIVGMIIGAILFYYQAGAYWPAIAETPVWKMLLIMVIGFTLLPVPLSMDIRGWTEMHPLNGPAWSLYFEYIANILYALVVRRFSNTVLAILVFLSGCVLIYLGQEQGDVIGGWAFDLKQTRVGMTRMMYPFFAGLLLSRMVKPAHIKNAFIWSGLLLIVFLSIPRLGGAEHLWMNGLYDSLVIIFVFPVIVFLGASGEVMGVSSKISKFLGDLSYPIYITHYPTVYIYFAWVKNSKTPLSESWPMAVLTFSICVLIGYLSLKLYDVPVRKWLTKRFMTKAV